jgi:CHAT domain-containing protein
MNGEDLHHPDAQVVKRKGSLAVRSSSVWWVSVSVAAVLAAVIALATWRRFSDPINQLRPTTHRVIQARLSVWDYAPYRVSRAGEAKQDYRTLAAAADLETRLQAARTVDNLHRFGLARIVLGETPRAVDLMNEAAKRAPGDVSVLADLAAVEIAAGRIEDGTEHAGRALDLEPTSATAAFNWALGLELMSNRPGAVAAWERYLMIDPVSGWAIEARQHLSALEQPSPSWERDKKLLRPGLDSATLRKIVRTYPQRVRALVQDELLLTSIESRDFKLATSIGREREESGDPFILDMVTHAAASAGNPDLVAGVKAFSDGRAAARRLNANEASATFAKAAEYLERAKSPLAIEAAIYAANHQFYAGQSAEALARLTAIPPSGNSQHYPCMEAELHWLRGLVLVSSGKPNEGMREYRTAMEAARRGQEWELQVGLLVIIVEALDEFGEVEDADSARRECLAEINKAGATPTRLSTAYENAASGSLKWGRPHIALEYARAALTMAQSGGDPMLIAESHFLSAVAHRELGSHAEAVADIAGAREYAVRIPTASLRDRATAEIDQASGVLYRSSDNERALQAFSAAITTEDRYGWRLHSAQSRFARGECQLARGDRGAAEADFRAAISDVESRRKFDEPGVQVAYFDRADAIFDRLIELLLAEGRSNDALLIAERKRARALLDRIGCGAGPGNCDVVPIDPASLAATLPPSSCLIQFAVLDRGVAIWTITRAGTEYAFTDTPRATLTASIARQSRALSEDDSAGLQREGRWLFERLIAPVESKLSSSSKLILAPDGPLYAVSFAALVGSDGRYLIEQFAISSTPSASILNLISAPSTRRRTLVIASASPTGLPPLQRAIPEAISVAALYPGCSALVGKEATPARFATLASEADIIHFAGHAVTDVRKSSRAALLFDANAAENGDNGARLTAAEIAQYHLTRRPVVVLAACSTGTGRVMGTEGLTGLASSFLSAGAGSVIVTLCKIDDADSERFFVDLHRHLRDGAAPADALRATQLAILHSGSKSPSSWAGVYVYGML